MLQRRTIIAAAAGLLLAAVAPVCAEPASPNDTARVLAGLQPAADSPLAAVTKDRGWLEQARVFDQAFERLDQRQLSKIRTWSEQNLATTRPTLFYMFSGPDFLYANAFYPKAKTYVLAGLEPVGTVPDLTNMRGSITPTMHQIRASIGTILNYSFFITAHMRSDLRAGRVNGTLPILYVFLARSGKTIKETQLVRVDADGTLKPDTDQARGNAARGVKIVFAGSDGEERTLYYFSTNLANDGVRNSGFLKFLETLAPGDGLIKSASYLPHSGGFSAVREFLLANTGAMVQDDSGVPLAYYDRKKWDLQPFGHYLGPIGVFPGMYQSQYAVLFRNARPIDFGIGYRWQPHQSNLLLAVKKTDAVAEGPAQPAAKEPAPESATTQSTPVHHSPARQRRAPAKQAQRYPLDWFFRSPR